MLELSILEKDSDQDYVGIINLSEQALSTSGDYERYFIKDGKRYHHILNQAQDIQQIMV